MDLSEPKGLWELATGQFLGDRVATVLSVTLLVTPPPSGFPGGPVGKESVQCGRPRFDPWIGKIPWGRKWQPTPVFLPGEFHGQRNLVGYSPWGYEESDATEQLSTLTLGIIN